MLWTPTLLVLDPQGNERHRVEGFLPKEEFLSQLDLGLARVAFTNQQWEEAERRYGEIVERFPNTAAASEALYWAGVARYKKTNDAAALKETAQAFKKKYPDSTWAKKADVWAA